MILAKVRVCGNMVVHTLNRILSGVRPTIGSVALNGGLMIVIRLFLGVIFLCGWLLAQSFANVQFSTEAPGLGPQNSLQHTLMLATYQNAQTNGFAIGDPPNIKFISINKYKNKKFTKAKGARQYFYSLMEEASESDVFFKTKLGRRLQKMYLRLPFEHDEWFIFFDGLPTMSRTLFDDLVDLWVYLTRPEHQNEKSRKKLRKHVKSMRARYQGLIDSAEKELKKTKKSKIKKRIKLNNEIRRWKGNLKNLVSIDNQNVPKEKPTPKNKN